MGCGSWTPHDWDSYSKSSIAGKSAAGIYTSKMMKAEFDPKDIPVRESRDSADHPSSNAIIIGLDVTGSMSDILEGVAKKLNVLVSEILDRKPVTDPQIMDDGDYDDIELRDRYLEVVLGECGLDYVGWTLDENDLTEHNLAELREMLSKEIKSVYKMDVSPNNLIFDFGEIYR